MTTTTNPGNYVDFDEYVGLKLEKTRSTIRTTDLLTALAGVASMFLGYLLLFVIFDQWILRDGFGPAWRWVLLSTLIISTIAWLVWKVGLPSFRTVNGLFAARQIENAEPGLKSNLLNLIDLKGAGRAVNPAILKAIERRAAVRLQQVDVSNAIDHRPLVRTAYILLAMIVLFCLYAVFSPKKISNSIWRGLLPAAQVPVATRTEIISVSPGDLTVPAHTPSVEVQVDLAGEIPPQVWLVYTTPDGKFTQQPVELRADDQGQTRFRGQLIGETAQGLMQDMTYSIRAGDAESAEFKLTVEQPPSAQIEKVRIEFPPYMKLDPIEQQNNGQIDAWEGAKVEVLAKTNTPVRSGILQFLDDVATGPTGEEIMTTVKQNGQLLQADWLLALRTDGSFPKYYRIDCKTEDGRRDTSPAVHGLTIRPDLPPEVLIVRPERDLEAAANATIPLLIQAQDPDFELGYLYLHVEKAGQKYPQEQISEGRQQKIMLKHDLSLAKLHVRKGDVIELWVEAYDNKQPRPNSRNTARLKISIQDPVTKKQADQQLAEENERIEQMLAEAEREPSSEEFDRTTQSEESDTTRDADSREIQPNEVEKNPREDSNERQTQNQRDKKPNDQQQRDAESQQSSGDQKSESGQSANGTKNDRSQSSDGRSTQDGSRQKPLSSDGSEDEEALKRLVEKFKQSSQDSPENPESGQDANSREQSSAQKDDPDRSDSKRRDPKQNQQGEKTQPEDTADEGHERKSDSEDNSKDSPPQDDNRATEKKSGKSTEKNPPDKSVDAGRKTDTASDQDSDQSANDTAKEKDSSQQKDQSSSGRDKERKTGKERSQSRPEKDESDSNASQQGEAETHPQNNESDVGSDPAATVPKPKNKTETQSEPSEGQQSSSQAEESGKDAEGSGAAENQSPEHQDGAAPKKNPSSNQGKSNPTSDASDPGDASGAEEPAPESPDAIKKRADGSEKGVAKPDRDPNSKPDRVKNDKVQRDPNEKPEKRPGQSPATGKANDPQQKSSKQPEKQEPHADGKKSTVEDATKETEQPKQGNEPRQSKPADAQNKKASPSKKGEQSPSSPENADPSSTSRDSVGSEEQKNMPNDAAGTDADSNQENSSQSNPGDGSDEASQSSGKESPGAKDQSSKSTAGKDASGKDSSNKNDSEKNVSSGKEENKDATGKDASDAEESGSGPESGKKSGGDKSDAGKESAGGKSGDKKKGDAGSKSEKKNDSGSQGSKEGDKGGAGKKGEKGDQSEDGGAAPGEGDGDQPGKGESSGKPSTQPGSTTPGKPGANPNGTGGAIGNDGTPSGASGDTANVEAGDDANLDYNRQATELVLQKLKKELERGDVDPELLEQLGWNQSEMQQFADRLSQYLNESKQVEESPEVTARQQQFNEMLKNLDLKKLGSQRSGETQPKRGVIQIESRRTPVPPAYRSAYEKFTRDIARQKAPAKK